MNLTYFGLLMLLSAIWGASFLFIKVGVTTTSPMTFAMLRVLIGSLTLLAIVRTKRQPLPRERSTWGHFLVMGALGIMVPFGAISWGTQYIPSGLSAILNAVMPLFTFVLAAISGDEHVTVARVFGLLLGFGGIIVLTAPQLGGVADASLWGQLAIVLAGLSYAVAIVYARRKLVGVSPIVASFGQVSMGFLLLVPVALFERPWAQHPSPEAIWSVIALGVFGTAIAYIIYYRLIQGIGATGASLVTYIVPVFGIFWGWSVLNERLAWNAFAALAMILVGLLFVNKKTT